LAPTRISINATPIAASNTAKRGVGKTHEAILIRLSNARRDHTASIRRRGRGRGIPQTFVKHTKTSLLS
jgi:hypothetical protein